MSTILVSGGAGYIGSHIAKLLAREGHVPVVLDNFSTGNRWAVKWGPLVEGDIGDADLVRKAASEYGIDAVVHLAASAYVGESMENPRKYFRNNVIASLRFFDALVESGVNKIVFSSTCATYGHPIDESIDERHPQNPANPYGETKLFLERALFWLGVAHGLKSVCLRYFNAAGADPEGEIGEHHGPETHLIPLAIRTALGQRDRLAVYGTDYPTGDGSAVRDYIHVFDLARAHALALQYLFSGNESTALNLGTGTGHSVLNVIDTVEKIAGRPVRRDYLPRRAGDPARLVASAKLAGAVLGWQAECSHLETIVQHAWQWQKQFSSAGSGG